MFEFQVKQILTIELFPGFQFAAIPRPDTKTPEAKYL